MKLSVSVTVTGRTIPEYDDTGGTGYTIPASDRIKEMTETFNGSLRIFLNKGA